MAKKTIDKVPVKGCRVLVRVDFNVPIEGGRITDDRRIRMAIPTIRSVIDRGGRAVLMSHLGRPEGTGYDAGESLSPVAAKLSELLGGKPVLFPSTDCTDEKSAAAVRAMQDGEVLLLENLRFHAGEKNGDAVFASKLAGLGDVYVNDAFGTCHREDASMVAVPRAMAGKPRVAGLLVERELRYLSEALKSPKKPFVVVLGGAKVSDKIPAVSHLMPRADAVLVGGAMAYTFLSVMGRKVGASRVEAGRTADAKRIIDEAAKLKCELILPDDHVCGTAFTQSGGDIEVFGDAIKDGYMGLDIGPKTQTRFAMLIERAGTVVWNGPMGVFEWPAFAVGTRSVASAMARATEKGAVTILGGGDTAAAAEKFGVAERVSHVSTGGGASLEMLSGAQFVSVGLLDEG